jgi:hypothetical protein
MVREMKSSSRQLSLVESLYRPCEKWQSPWIAKVEEDMTGGTGRETN